MSDATFGGRWSEAEDRWIRERYPSALPEDGPACLPGRSPNAIKHRASRLGVKKNPDVIAIHNSRTNKGRVRTPENRAKISRSLTGKKQSEETRRKHSEAARRIAKIGPDNPNWKERVTEDQSRWRARRTVPNGPCALCDNPGTDVHHKDGNPFNNAPDNLTRLCAKHHRQEHARMNRERRSAVVNEESAHA